MRKLDLPLPFLYYFLDWRRLKISSPLSIVAQNLKMTTPRNDFKIDLLKLTAI